MTSADPGRAGSGAFVGREDELSRLAAVLAEARRGMGSLVFVTGDAGLGKTALTQEFLRRARSEHQDLPVLVGRCVEQYGAGEAYLPFLDAAGTLLLSEHRADTVELLQTYAPTWCLQLPAATLPEPVESLERRTIGATKERMLRECGDVFAALCARSPVVLLVEDLEWADTSSIDLLRHLGNRLPGQRLLIVGTYRPAELQAAKALQACTRDLRAHTHCHEIALGPLRSENVAAYLRARFEPNNFPADLAYVLHRRTEGHPLFLVSLVQFMQHSGDLVRSGEAWALGRDLTDADLGVPESVHALIRRKVEALDAEDHRTLQFASVIGRDFLSTVLAALLETEELLLEERLHRLSRTHGLIEAQGEEELPDGSLTTRYYFTHGLYQEVLYAELVSRRRVLLHGQAGVILASRYGVQAPRIAAQLALHFERGRDAAGAITALVDAADNAARLYANGAALGHFGHALQLVPRLPPEEQSRRSLLLHQRRGAVHLTTSLFGRAAEDYTLALERARAGGTAAEECAALSGLCNALFFSRRLEEMALHAHEAMDAAARADDDTLRLESSLLLAPILQDSGDLAESRPLLEEAIATARGSGHVRSLLDAVAYRGIVHYWESEYAVAAQRLEEALALASELRDGFRVLMSEMFLGLAYGNQGRLSKARATFERGIEMARRNDDRFWLPRLASHLGWVHRELEDFEEAIRLDQEGLRIAREVRVPDAEASARLNLCLAFAHAGRGDEALAVVQDLAAVTSEGAWPGWLYEIRHQTALGEVWLIQGDLPRAKVHAERLLEAATRHGTRTYVVAARGLLASEAAARDDPAQAAIHLGAALEILSENPMPLIAWRTYAMVGRLAHDAGDAAAAREAFTQAAATIREIAQGVTDPILQERFLASKAVQKVWEGAGGQPGGARSK